MSDGLKMKYFVVKPRGDDEYAHASRAALLAYASAIQHTSPQLAEDLREWVALECPEGPVPK